MRSDLVKKGYAKAPSRSLLRVVGLKYEDFTKSFIGVANSFIKIIAWYIYFNRYAEIVKDNLKYLRKSNDIN